MNQSNRLQALDVLRGITVAGMILVNTPGSWNAVYAPLCHAWWNGLTPTDLVFPFFMFIMGISMFFSLRKYDFKPSPGLFMKIFRRAVLIFLISLGINWFAMVLGAVCDVENTTMTAGQRFINGLFPFDQIRIPGVLQRLAVSYFGAALISLWVKPKYYLWVAAGILVAYWGVLAAGQGFTLTEGNIIGVVDRAVFGDAHILKAWTVDKKLIGFDPEGLVSTLPCFAHVLFGMFVGRMLGEVKENGERIRQLFIFGTVLLFGGYLLSYGCPVNKKVWTSTYVMITCGAATQLFALLIYFIDVKGYRRWCGFFEAFGVNPLFIYVLSEVLAIALGYICFPYQGGYVSLQGFFYTKGLASWMDPYVASLVYGLLFVMLNWWVAHILYKKKIFIKI